MFAVAPSALSQSYSIDWFKIAAGGGVSTNGPYQVTATIGQPDAGPSLSAGSFSISGGFWSLLSAVPTPGSPPLSIALTATNTAVISWSFPSTGFTLQQNSDLSTTNWIAVPQSVTNNGAINYVIINPPGGNRFYRLVHP